MTVKGRFATIATTALVSALWLAGATAQDRRSETSRSRAPAGPDAKVEARVSPRVDPARLRGGSPTAEASGQTTPLDEYVIADAVRRQQGKAVGALGSAAISQTVLEQRHMVFPHNFFIERSKDNYYDFPVEYKTIINFPAEDGAAWIGDIECLFRNKTNLNYLEYSIGLDVGEDYISIKGATDPNFYTADQFGETDHQWVRFVPQERVMIEPSKGSKLSVYADRRKTDPSVAQNASSTATAFIACRLSYLMPRDQ